MFSGIIEELGIVKRISRTGNATLFEISALKITEGIEEGGSVSVNGVCLTVVKSDKSSVNFEVIPETLKATNLGSLRISERINLERSLKMGDRLSGHFVLGHIDCLGIIRKKNIFSGNLILGVAVPAAYIKYCLPKGSIAIDGISLTIQKVKPPYFYVYIIPHTLKNTTLSFKGPSDKVNVEFDIFAKKQS